MMKRSVLVAMAAALFATVAFTAPCRADSTLVTTIGYFALTPGSASADEWDFYYQTGSNTPLPGMASLNIVDTGGLTITSATINAAAGEVVILFDPANATTGTANPLTAGLEFTFTTTAAVNNVFQGPVNLYPSGSTHSTNVSQISAAAVPEPASVALLGIGMTAFLAFRRFFKKASAV
jgi:PEP-CTERM motif